VFAAVVLLLTCFVLKEEGIVVAKNVSSSSNWKL
jgi:hypothetical protein